MAQIEEIIAEGVRQHEARNFAAAERSYRAALTLDPTHPRVLAMLGVLAGMTGNFAVAADLLAKALPRDPNNPDLHYNLGDACRRIGDYANALSHFTRAIQLRPEFLIAYRAAAETALAASAQTPDPTAAQELKRLALNNQRTLGWLLHQQRHPDGVAMLREALAIDPFDVETIRKLGNALYEHGQLTEAAEMFQRALTLDPGDANVASNLGTSLFAMRRWHEAEDAFRRALQLDPNHTIARTNIITCALMGLLYEDELTADEVYNRHRQWGDDTIAKLAATAKAEDEPFPNDRDPDRRLRIGFISGDFRDHPVAQFFRPLLAHHDRAVLDVYCYAEGERADAYTTLLQKTGGIWRMGSADAPDAALRTQLRADAIDIVVEMSGQTAGTRLGALAVRAAPVTASWLAYPATTGLRTIDWRITDALADPPGAERYYVEKLMRLPNGFLCYEPRAENPPAVPVLPALLRGDITFGSFNNILKITPATVRCWAAILHAVPRARLVLKAGTLADPGIRQSVAWQFAALGVNTARVELRGQVPGIDAHFAGYGEIDIGLDPLIYNGTTTTCEALWMGVPVITAIGDRHAARVSFDLLSRIGLSELAAPDAETYVALAAKLAGDLPRLRRLRGELRERMQRSSLCDATHFARAFEAALREMWHQWCAEHCVVTADRCGPAATKRPN